MPMSLWGTTPTDTTPILITNLKLNQNGYALFKGLAGYEDTITLADNVDSTLLLQPNNAPAGPNARTLWVKDFNGVTQLSVDIFTGLTTINNLVVNGTASVGFLPGFGQNIPTLIVQGAASIGSLGVGKTTIIGPLNTFSNPASWNPTLIIDDLPSSTNNVVEFRTNGTRRGSIVAQNSNNIAVNGVSTGAVLLNYLEGTGGTRFGNGSQLTVGTVDSGGVAAFNGYKTLNNATASFAALNTVLRATIVGTTNTSTVTTTWQQALIVDSGPGSTNTVTEFRLNGSRDGSIRTDSTGNVVLNSFGAGAVYLAFDEGTGGVVFGNGGTLTVGSVDGTGKATFNGGLIASATASVANIQVVPGGTNNVLTLLANSTVGVGGIASITFSSIPATYTHLMLVFSGCADLGGTAPSLGIQFNGDTGNHYVSDQYYDGGLNAMIVNSNNTPSNPLTHGTVPQASGATHIGQITVHINSYTGTTFYKTTSAECTIYGGSFIQALTSAGVWQSSAAINQIVLFPFGGGATKFVQGTVVSLYGLP